MSLTTAAPNESDVQACLDAGQLLPSHLYTNSSVFRAEMQEILSKNWQYLTRAETVASPGDVAVGKAGDIPVVVTRDEQGELRAFVNVCRHRLYLVAESAGNRTSLQCRYHGWTYGLDGCLLAAPRSPKEMRPEFADLALEPVDVAVWEDLVFVNPDPSPTRLSLSAALGELAPLASERGFDLSAYRYVSTATFEHQSNWKISVENALECYHCPLVHKTSFGRFIHVAENTYLLHNFENGNVAQFAGVKRAPTSDRHAAARTAGFELYYVWPSTFISVDAYVATVVYLVPTAVDRTEFVVESFAHQEIEQEVLDEWTEMWTQTFSEDQQIVAGQQHGYASGRVPVGRLLERSEGSIQAFQRRLWRELEPHLKTPDDHS
jgi:phenylpropionate dioxygenase-like ring-hydroxylating dioxygenase large terminal subunit